MKLYKTRTGIFLEHQEQWFQLPEHDWDRLVNHDDLQGWLVELSRNLQPSVAPIELLAPIGNQEVWAAGVTYYRSRTARMEESEVAGGADFYDRVYNAERPELFFKATPHRVVGPNGELHLRSDSRWMVPEPELALLVNRRGRIVGYTIGNDLSCRDIEGENPLYLPQAKLFDRCAGLGPGIWISNEPPPAQTTIELSIVRGGAECFSGSTDLSQLRKPLASLVEYLFRDNSFPVGCFLMTGTGIVPEADFSLWSGDRIEITILPIGKLVNSVMSG